MAVSSEEISTLRGDQLKVTLFTHAGQEPTIMVTLADADDTVVPTAEFTLAEAGSLRDTLRRLCEEGWRSTHWPTRWP